MKSKKRRSGTGALARAIFISANMGGTPMLQNSVRNPKLRRDSLAPIELGDVGHV